MTADACLKKSADYGVIARLLKVFFLQVLIVYLIIASIISVLMRMGIILSNIC